MTYNLLVSVLALLVAIGSLIFAVAARKRAMLSVADSMRLDAIEERRMSVFAGTHESDWGVMVGPKLMSASSDLRTAIDTALNEGEPTNG